MATDPNLLMHLVNAPGLAAQSVFAGQNQALGARQANQEYRLGEQTLGINKIKMAAAQQQQAQAQQYQSDVSDYLADPSPAKLSALMSRHTDQADALKKAWDVKDGAQRSADMGQFGAIYSALDNGKTDLAIGQLRQRRDAEKAQGVDTTDLDHYLEALASGDPAAIKAVKGFALAQIAAGDRDKFSEIFKTVGGERGTKVVGAGGALVDEEGNELYKAPFAPQIRSVSPGDTLVETQPGGGDPASGGGGSAGRYTGGWTPRARNGGDNNDAAVDGKIGGMSKALSIAPTEPFPPGMSNMAIAKALTLSEGGAGSIADRNNNPGNLRDPKTGEFRKFPTKEAGLAAAAAQVARNRARGQNTIQSMVEGVPAGGQSAGPRVIAQGAPKQKDAPSGYRWAADGNLEPIPGGPGDKGRSGAGRAVPEWVAKRAEPKYTALTGLQTALGNFKDEFAGHSVLGNLSNDIQGVTGVGPKGQRDWWAQFAALDNQIRNALFGASLTEGEKAAYNRTTITPRMTPPEVRRNLNTRLDIAQRVAERERSFLKSQGYDAQTIDQLLPPSQMAGSGGAPVRVRSIQQAQKLAPGTIYIAPDGKKRRR